MKFGGVQGSSLTFAHPLQGLSSLAEEAARPTENPEQVQILPSPLRQIAQGPRGRRENPGFSYSGVGPFEAELGFSCVLPPCRLDILHQVAMWQKNFKRIVSQGGGKELPGEVGDGTQRKAHHWVFSELLGWGVAHGPRGPTSYYYMLPMKVRALGLKVALTIKLAQDDLHIMDSLELPTGDPQYLTELAHYRRWGNSVLLVDL
uniref:Large ribosomal subunit protein uL4m n=1 Tax=Nomascus leucogenys TaxID=61853 RepID=A0A2I3HTY4_NOMLE